MDLKFPKIWRLSLGNSSRRGFPKGPAIQCSYISPGPTLCSRYNYHSLLNPTYSMIGCLDPHSGFRLFVVPNGPHWRKTPRCVDCLRDSFLNPNLDPKKFNPYYGDRPNGNHSFWETRTSGGDILISAGEDACLSKGFTCGNGGHLAPARISNIR